MNLYARLLIALCAGLFKTRRHHLESSSAWFRVWPHDLDLFGHMNNGRYLQIMDVARADWMLRTGVAGVIQRYRLAPVLGGGMTSFRHPLRLFQRYQVRTRLVHWDSRWFYFEHVFVTASGRRLAVGVSRAALRAEGKWADTQRIAESIDPQAESPSAPAYLERWLAADQEIGRAERVDLLDAVRGDDVVAQALDAKAAAQASS